MWTEKQAIALASVFDSLNQSGLRWLVLRNYEGLPYENSSKDIDLIVEESRLDESSQIICAALKLQGFQLYTTTKYGGACAITCFKTDNNECQSIKIDVMHSINWRGADIVTFAQVYHNSKLYNNFKIPDVSMSAFLLFVKTFLMGGRLKKTYVSEIKSVIRENSEKFYCFLKDSFDGDVAEKIWNLLVLDHVDAALQLGKSARVATWFRFIRKKPLLTAKRTVSHFGREFFRRAGRSPGSMIAVVGPDGVGKTTFIELLRQELSHILVKNGDAILVSHFRPNVLPNIKKLLSGKNYDPSTEDFANPHRAKPAALGSSIIRMTYYWLDYVLGYCLVIHRKCAQGNVLIFDRYFYDFIVDPYRSRIKLPKRLRLLFLMMTPEPDVVFFLNCEAATIYKRKQELTKEEIARQLEAYKKLASGSKRFVILDAKKKTPELCNDAIRNLIEKSFKAL